jgi:putative ABC transport system permease protein
MHHWYAIIRKQLEPLHLSAARESEIAEELAQHAEERYRELIANGAMEDHAQAATLDELTQHQLLARELRAVERTNIPEPHVMGKSGGPNLVGGLARDVRYALRNLTRNPRFTVFAVLMLAVGIGATTAIYSIVEGVLLRPLPFPDPERLVVVGDHVEGTNWGDGENFAPVTAPEIRTYARDTHTFESLGGFSGASFELSSGGEPAAINGTRMTAGVFPTLGVAPLLGRVFTEEEDAGRQTVVVLSYATWKNRFQGNPSVVGTKILLNRKPYLVIGVMPQNFEFPLTAGQLSRSGLWVPTSFSEQELTKGAGSWNMVAVGRLKPGITPAQAQMDADRVSQEIMRQFPANIASIHINAVVQSLRDLTITGARPLVRTLFLAVVVVLLIACANLAGLLLLRVIRRQREIALRLALGASVAVLMRQLLLESLVLSTSGGVLGIGLAWLALHLGKRFLPDSLPRINEIELNWGVVGFALCWQSYPGCCAASHRPLPRCVRM